MILVTCAHLLEAKSMINKFYLEKKSGLPFSLFGNDEINLLITNQEIKNTLKSLQKYFSYLNQKNFPLKIYNFGICAALDFSLSLEEVVFVETISHCKEIYSSHSHQVKKVNRFREVSCLSVSEPIFDLKTNASLRKKYQVLDMELSAIVKIATLNEIPWASYKMVSDYANSIVSLEDIRKIAQTASDKFSQILQSEVL